MHLKCSDFIKSLFSLSLSLDDSSSENGSTANGLPALTPPGGAAMATGGVPASEGAVPYGEVNGNGAAAPLDFSNTSSSSSSQEGQQPVNLSDRLLPGGTLGSLPNDLKRTFPVKTEYGSKVCLIFYNVIFNIFSISNKNNSV